jgi:hypothetical protein
MKDATQKQNNRQNKGLYIPKVYYLFYKRTRLKEYKVQIIQLLPVFILQY